MKGAAMFSHDAVFQVRLGIYRRHGAVLGRSQNTADRLVVVMMLPKCMIACVVARNTHNGALAVITQDIGSNVDG